MKTNALIHLKGYRHSSTLTYDSPKAAVLDTDFRSGVNVRGKLSYLHFYTSSAIKGIREGEEMMDQDCCILTRESSFWGNYLLCIDESNYLCINSPEHRPNFLQEEWALEESLEEASSFGYDIAELPYKGASEYKHRMALERMGENISYRDYQDVMECMNPDTSSLVQGVLTGGF